jgi:D-tyrosyl-tRNA(Tyr) deacylase
VRAVVQRVSRAAVRVDGEVVGRIDRPGLCALVGVTHDDTVERAENLARKLAELRILRHPEGPDGGRDERSALDNAAPILVISQFTVYADTRRGRRPSWGAAAAGPVAEPLVEAVMNSLRARGLEVASGRFGADMAVELVNDGPVTLVVEV